MELRRPGFLTRGAGARGRRRTAALLTAGALLLGAGTAGAVAAFGGDGPTVHESDRMMAMLGATIDTAFFTAGDPATRRPAVLLAHGFGGNKDDMRGEAEQLARHGYAVLTWSARGFGRSTGRIGLNDPSAEVADVSRLIDWLAKRPEVQLDAPGDPRVGISGASYGGAIALLAAGYDHRVDAIAPRITYWNLADALFPNGVFKKLWAGVFVSSGGGCDHFTPALCAMYTRVAEAGKPDDAAVAMLQQRSPLAVGTRIDVPTYLVQGQTDSLFPLDQADQAAHRIAANGAPVAMDWISGGHDGGDMESARVDARTAAWFDRYLKGERGVDTGPAFRISRTAGVSTSDARITLQGAQAGDYPGLGGSAQRAFALSGPPQSFSNPPGGAPPDVSSLPGAGGLAQLGGLGFGLALQFPGQSAHFDTAPLREPLRLTGSSTVRVRISSSSPDAVVFAKLYDVAADGRSSVLPQQLVAPQRIAATGPDTNGDGQEVLLHLPAIDHEFDAGHRLRLVLASTDLGYASPSAAATYRVQPVSALTVPLAPEVRPVGTALPAWTWALPLLALALAAALLLTGRRRRAAPPPDPALAEVPLQITGLSKKYAGGDRYSVRELSFRVEKGQVLGLLGPNGAGKTTTLRMLMGLIHPDEGEIRLFGHAVRPGAPVLSRVGSFVEGAGFLPHLTGRQNLELYWRATGRPAEDAHLDEALRIANLGSALERSVRSYSQGMRQRLAIAQAMLGLPELLILDEPTNGLDPPQIREMREVMIRYAAAGRTVIVSSHLLAEVEQTCTHLVVMDRGRLVQAGPVAEITGSGEVLAVATAVPVDETTLAKVAALKGVAGAERTEDGLLVRLDGASAAQLTAELVRLEVPVSSLGPHRRLEDAFLSLISGGAGA